MAEFTPGPWEYNENHGFTYGIHPVSRESVASPIASNIHGEANARLIALAPELLEAAQLVMADLVHYVSMHGPGPDKRLEALQAAITKATGA